MRAFNCQSKGWEDVQPTPLTDDEIAKLQEQADRDAARAKVLERTRPLNAEEVTSMLIRQQVNTLAVDDQTALRMRQYYPTFAELTGKTVKQGTKFRADDSDGADLYKVIQPELTIQAHYPPGAGTEALYTRIDETHDGTRYDPVPAARGMEYTYGLYYADGEDGKLYLCQRTGEADGGTVVLQYLPHELVGHYFVEVS